MRFFSVTIITLLSMQACSQKRDSGFIAKITDDFSRNSYFIVLDVSLPAGITTSLIENDDLYYYFYKTKGYNENRYKEEIRMIIKKNKVLTVTNVYFSKFGFSKVENLQKLNDDAKKGKGFIMGKYFKNYIIKDGVTKNERNVLIKMLFDWNIPSKIDDESGYLIIESK